jgi:hypothetical protein
MRKLALSAVVFAVLFAHVLAAQVIQIPSSKSGVSPYPVYSYGAYGISSDDCPAIQTALDTAATYGSGNSGASGLVVLDSIKYTCNTPLTWDPAVTSIQCNGAMIDASAATFTGPLISVTQSHNQKGVTGGGAQYYQTPKNSMTGCYFKGPGGSGTTDLFYFGTPTNANGYNSKVYIQNVSASHFRYFETYGSNAYLITFNNVVYANGTAGIYNPSAAGIVNSGENITHYGGSIGGMSNASVLNGQVMTFNFFGTSFDFSTVFIEDEYGVVNCTICHFEANLSALTTPPFTQAGVINSQINLYGGDITLDGGSGATAISCFLNNGPSAYMNLEGVTLTNMGISSNTFACGVGSVVFRNSKFNQFPSDFTAIKSWGVSGGTNDQYIRQNNLLYDGSFENSSITDLIWIGADTATVTSRTTGTNVSVSLSTDTALYGTHSLKLTKTGAAGTAAGVWIAAPFPTMQTASSLNNWAKPGSQTGSFTMAVEYLQVLGFDGNGIPVVGQVATPGNLSGASSKSLTSSAIGWTAGQTLTLAALGRAPSWSNYIGLYIDLTAMNAGSIYIDGVIFNSF